jgi:hypothetical protein
MPDETPPATRERYGRMAYAVVLGAIFTPLILAVLAAAVIWLAR